MDDRVHEACGHPWRHHGTSGCHHPTEASEGTCACCVPADAAPVDVAPCPGQLDMFGGAA